MNSLSPLQLIKDVEAIISRAVIDLDIYELPTTEQRLITQIKNNLNDARLDIRDYDSSDNQSYQEKLATKLNQRLTKLNKSILKLSEYNLLSAVDVAQVSAQLSLIVDMIAYKKEG